MHLDVFQRFIKKTLLTDSNVLDLSIMETKPKKENSISPHL